MTKIVGVVARPELNKIGYIGYAIRTTVEYFGMIPFPIIPKSFKHCRSLPTEFNKKDWHKFLEICDGFILQGGAYGYEHEMDAIKHAHDYNKPILGICMGMQNMGIFLGGSLVYLNNREHQNPYEYAHFVDIKEDSELYKIVGQKEICVNSLHIEHIINLEEKYVVARNDNIIEAIEDKSKDFFLGVQWHPELLNDENSESIFESYCKTLRKNK